MHKMKVNVDMFELICLIIFYPSGMHSQRKGFVEDIQTALNLGNSTANYTREDCVWRPNNNINVCPDPDINFYLYSGKNQTRGEKVNMSQGDFLRIHNWDPSKQNVILIHGYAGGDGIYPSVILRDAYIKNGSYNVFVVDWGQLSRTPCYVAAVHNLRTVAQCTAHLFNFIRNTGISSKAITCVGHSLGAHICGLISYYLLFRVHRIIALDPARPLIRSAVRLKPGMAETVQVIHTNAGNYGESGKIGKIDFCLNGGKVQPICENKTRVDLCSHVLSICYLAESIDISNALKATPCSRRCPTGPRPSHRIGLPVLLGEHTPDNAAGSYCVNTKETPYCIRNNPNGHPWCCLDENQPELQKHIGFRSMKVIKFFLVTSILIENIWLDALNINNNHTEDDRFTLSLGPCYVDTSDPCASDKISFYLYTRNSMDNAVKLTTHDKSLPFGYNITTQTKILIHGYAGNVDFKGIVIVRRAYQRSGYFNVIVVDWGELVKLPCYPTAVVNTVQAGKCVALFLTNLARSYGHHSVDFHAVGFSLGAHVASFASNEFERMYGKKLQRISGLDPALPFFASLSKSWKLDKGDAEFVDVIHTNAGIFGKIEASGHVDFYVNDGFSQPSCNDAQNIPLCSHVMALFYYAESITANVDNGFWAVPCSSYVQHVIGLCDESNTGNKILMGEHCDTKSRGIYFVRTRDRPPYALGKDS